MMELLFLLCLAPVIVMSNVLTDSQKDLILKIHNDYRRDEPASNMRELVWSKEAEEAADRWARKCVFEHENKGWGENIAFVANPSLKTEEEKIKSMHKAWHDEKKLYTYGQKSCGTTGACHYTQIVWAKTAEVGCSIIKCNPYYSFGQALRYDGLSNLVCFYKPRANFEPGAPFERGSHCSKCPSGTTCKDKLCSVGGGTDKPDEGGDGENTDSDNKPDEGNGGGQGSQPGGGNALDEREKYELLNVHNEIRKSNGKSAFTWDDSVQRFVEWIIRCDVQYPGMADTDYSNYAKVKDTSLVAVVKDWGKEDINSNLDGKGCVSIRNNRVCNHHSNIVSDANKIACAAKDCGSSGRQLTCIYRI